MPRNGRETDKAYEDALRTLLLAEADGPVEVLDQSRAWDLIQARGWDFTEDDDEQLLAALTLIDLVREQADQAEGRLLQVLRRDTDPVSWDRIAAALGMSRQGAERRLLRSTGGGRRDADDGRRSLRVRREHAERDKQLCVARWGRWGPAARDWHLTVRARKATGETVTARVRGYTGQQLYLNTYFFLIDGEKRGPVWLKDLEVLEVVEEVTPWPDVEPPGTLAGLTSA